MDRSTTLEYLYTRPHANAKTKKGVQYGHVTFLLHLAPAHISGYQACPMATEGCRSACLNFAGRGGMFNEQQRMDDLENHPIHGARILKTRWFFEDRDAFMARLVKETENALRWAAKQGKKASFRLNGTSDIRWETVPVVRKGKTYRNIMEAFPRAHWYDYTKIPNRRNLPDNYHLTFSLAESNAAQAVEAVSNGMNVAVVFREELPQEFHLGPITLPVHNGDTHDLRFLDPKGVVVGLKAKGRYAKRDRSGFVCDTNRRMLAA